MARARHRLAATLAALLFALASAGEALTFHVCPHHGGGSAAHGAHDAAGHAHAPSSSGIAEGALGSETDPHGRLSVPDAPGDGSGEPCECFDGCYCAAGPCVGTAAALVRPGLPTEEISRSRTPRDAPRPSFPYLLPLPNAPPPA